MKYLISVLFIPLFTIFSASAAEVSASRSSSCQERRLTEFEATKTLKEAIDLLIAYHAQDKTDIYSNGYGHPFHLFLRSPAHYSVYIHHLNLLSQNLTPEVVTEIILSSLTSIRILPTLADTNFLANVPSEKDINQTNANEFILQILNPSYSPQIQEVLPIDQQNALEVNENHYAGILLEERAKLEHGRIRREKLDLQIETLFSLINDQIELYLNQKETLTNIVPQIEQIIIELVKITGDQNHQRRILSIFEMLTIGTDQHKSTLQDIQAVEQFFRRLIKLNIIDPFAKNTGGYAHHIIMC